MTTLYNPLPSAITMANGRIAAGARAYFYTAGTSSVLTVYQDAAGTTPHDSPVVASAGGVLPPVFLPYTTFRVRITTAGGVLLMDQDNIPNPSPPSSGGGSGIVVQANQILRTGDIIARVVPGIYDGLVRLNGRTIGSAGSGATERANADCSALYAHLWEGLSDTYAPVTGGRGVSAAADFAANKPIGLIDTRGRALFGGDAQGASTAGISQVSTTCTATGTTTVTVASATGLYRTMKVKVNGVSAGVITNISGTTITTSIAVASGTGVPFVASPFDDADKAGSVGGSISFIQSTLEMPAHTHPLSVSDPGHAHAMNSYTGTGRAPGDNSVNSSNNYGSSTGGATTGISVSMSSTGGGLAMPIMPPGIVTYWYQKL